MDCPICDNEMEFKESTYSNYNSNRAIKSQHTGDVYRCEICEETYLDDFLSGKLRVFNYE
jgi:hypothetical protein